MAANGAVASRTWYYTPFGATGCSTVFLLQRRRENHGLVARVRQIGRLSTRPTGAWNLEPGTWTGHLANPGARRSPQKPVITLVV